jgi:protein-histidine pros-kinase
MSMPVSTEKNRAGMSLLFRVNLILAVVFGVGLAVMLALNRGLLMESAHREAMNQAELMMLSARAARQYTSENISPLLQDKLQDQFLPETVPAFAAARIFERLRKDLPNYSYKEATLNPTNLDDRAADWEADVVRHFRNFPDLKEWSLERESPGGTMLVLARPIRIESASCLLCHSTPQAAPAAFRARYGDNNGYGWQVGEVVGSQIVSVPAAVPQELAGRLLREFVIVVASTMLAVFAAVDVALILFVIRPLRKMSAAADALSKGEENVAEFETRGASDIVALGAAFNRMRRSLEKAMQMLAR